VIQVAPPWVRLLDPFCRYQTRALSELRSDERVGELAGLLQFLTVEDSRSSQLLVPLGEAVLDANRDCLRVIDAFCDLGGVALCRSATSAAMHSLAMTLPRRLRCLPDLPDGARRVLLRRSRGGLVRRMLGLGDNDEEVEGEDSVAAALAYVPRLVDALTTASDPRRERDEPSWGVLGALIRETAFVELNWSLALLKRWLSVETEPFVDAALKVIPQHPYRAMIAVGTREASLDASERTRILKDVRFTDPVFAMAPLMQLMESQTGDIKERGQAAWDQAWYSLDRIEPDILEVLSLVEQERDLENVPDLQAVSPYHPRAIAILIRDAWDTCAARAPDWEREYRHQPRVLGMLAAKYTEQKRWTDAVRCLKAYINLAPSHAAYRRLAEIYLDQGDEPAWKRTIDESLQSDDFGLEDATACAYAANYFMSKGRFEEALPYADRAAASWSSGGMKCAATCHEGLGDWATAERWVVRAAERYPGSAYNWLLWCVRTGRGDRQAAHYVALRWLSDWATQDDSHQLQRQGVVYYMCGKPREAVQRLEQAFEQDNDPWSGLAGALIADELKDTEARDRLLRGIVDKGSLHKERSGAPRQELIDYADWVQRCLRAGTVSEEEHGVLQVLISAAPGSEPVNLLFFSGRFFELRGDVERAKANLSKAADDARQTLWAAMLARDKLRAMGIHPADHSPKVKWERK
jgi:tetratricopeptide (TPR) repeat protein